MTIYHMGTEDIHFLQGGGATVTSLLTSPFFRSGWSRCALHAGFGEFWRAPLQSDSVSTSEFWWTSRLCQQSSVIATRDWIRFLDGHYWRLAVWGRGNEIPQLLFHPDVPDGDPDTYDILAYGTVPMFASNKNGKVDIYVNLGTGTFRLYLDHVLALDFTGDLTGGLYSSITGYDLWGGHFEGSSFFSEVMWRTEDTRSIAGIQAIWPVDDGVNMQWTGIKEDVDEITVDESDANYTSSSGLVQEYQVLNLPANTTNNLIVSSVMVGARMATASSNEAVVVRTGGTDFLSTGFSTGGAIEDRMNIWETNPDTSAEFTIDEVNDIDFNIGVAST